MIGWYFRYYIRITQMHLSDCQKQLCKDIAEGKGMSINAIVNDY